jgi:Raf kinase inhibitor-like YbhB/YbcL family protein
MIRTTLGCALAAVSLVAAASAIAAPAGKFTLTSPDVANGKMMAEEQVFNSFGCKGGNLSPDLKWDGAPDKTKSFALTIYDPDAPTGSGWWHWVVVDIPATSHELPKGWGKPGVAKLQGGRQTRTDFGASGYGGPCPPPGKAHRYVITLSALDIDKVDVPDDASGALVGFNLGAHTLGKAVITAKYGVTK